MVNKTQIIQENRDRLRNQKEIERKAKKDAKMAKKERLRMAREKSLFEVKQKIENKKLKLKKEDEIFQKKYEKLNYSDNFSNFGEMRLYLNNINKSKMEWKEKLMIDKTRT